MKLICTGLLLFFLITFEISWGGQQIETVVFPSEDEIVEALSLGEISIEQFYLLMELITLQVKPTSFMLDEIPNSLLNIDTIQGDGNQSQYFIESNKKILPHVTINNRYASYLDENPSTRYQSSVLFHKDNYDLSFTFKKEFSNRKRFIRRYMSYTSPDNSTTFIMGNFIKRFGLGGIVGYRGKLLSYSDELDDESFLFPDYGGFNGLYAKKQFRNYLIESVISYNRDSSFSIFTKAIMFKYKKFPKINIAHNELTKRDSSYAFHDIKTSLFHELNYSKGQISVELIAEFNKLHNSSAFVFDGKHKTNKNQIKYSLWHYGESFLNISGGSKTSLISEKVAVDSTYVEFSMNSKHNNQTGGLLKYNILLSHKLEVDLASLYAFKNSDTTELQLYGKFIRKCNSTTEVSLDFLFNKKIRNSNSLSSSQNKFQNRLIFTYSPNEFYSRTYLSLINRTDEKYYGGFFSELKYKSNEYGVIHLWFNFSRLDLGNKKLDYFYGFIKNEISMYRSLYVGFKFSHRYNRLATDKYQNQFSIDVRWQI